MWRLVREEIRFSSRILMISWAFGIGIFTVVLTMLAAFGSVSGIASLLKVAQQLPVAILVASMVAGFIVTGTERSESRVRVLMMLPLTLRAVAVARVIVPAALMLFGLALSHLLFAALLALGGEPPGSMRHLGVIFIGVQLFLWIVVTLLGREIVELVKRNRRGAAAAWTAAAAAALGIVVWLLVGSQEAIAPAAAVVAGLDAALMASVAALFVRRRDFTR